MEQGALPAERTTAPKNRFDLEDRERVRDTLIAYMKRRGIGVPTLQAEIATAHKINLDRLPLSTLQRFLAGRHRTHDAFVRLCYDYCEGLPMEDSAGRFAAALKVFFGCAVAGGESADTLPPMLQTHVRDRGLRRRNPDVTTGTDGTRFIIMNTDTQEIRYSELSCRGAGSAWQIRERLLNWAFKGEPPADPAVARCYEGAAHVTEAGGVMLLRNLLTGKPRTYVIVRHEDGLVGRACEPASLLDAGAESRPGNADVDTTVVTMTPLEGEAQAGDGR